MHRLLPDIRVAVRRLSGDLGFTLVAVLTLGLGIGANAAIFTLVRTVLLRPLPYGDPSRVVMLWNAAEPGGTTWLSVQELASYRRTATSRPRTSARASSRLTTFAQAMGRTNPTAPKGTSSAGRTSPVVLRAQRYGRGGSLTPQFT